MSKTKEKTSIESPVAKPIDWELLRVEFQKVFKHKLRVAVPPKGDAWDTSKNYKALAYIEARDVMDRLDDVVGIGSWSVSYEELADGGNIKCSLTVHGVTKEDVGDKSNFAATKGGFSDSLKRAAVNFGIGRYLYSLPLQFVRVDKWGNILDKEKTSKKEEQLPWEEPKEPVKSQREIQLEGDLKKLLGAIEGAPDLEYLDSLGSKVDNAKKILSKDQISLLEKTYGQQLVILGEE